MTLDLETLVTDARAMVECESPSSDHEALARSADVIARIGHERLGVEPERIVLDGCTHLRWRLGDGEGVLLLGHHDTVWPTGSLAAHPFVVEDGVMRGPGCVDMKAGLAMAFHAAAGLGAGVTLLVTGDEELGAPTSRGLIEAEARSASAVLVLEAAGPGGALKTERKGVSRYDVHLSGRAAHAGLEPERGANTTVELAHQVLAVAALADDERGTTVTPTLATSGSSTNTVPAAASFAVDVRAWTGAEQQRVDEAMRALTPSVPGTRVRVDGGPNRDALEAGLSRDLFKRAVEVAARLGLPEPAPCAVGGASDGNFAAGVGTPTLDGLGASGGGAHADDEHVLVDELLGRTRLVRGLLEDLLVGRSR